MKIVSINSVYGFGSTGAIVKKLYEETKKLHHEHFVFYGRKKQEISKEIQYISNPISLFIHFIISRLFSLHGRGSLLSTYKLVKKIKKINPDIVHLHNLHGYYLNYKILMHFLIKNEYKIIWTLHDTWLIEEMLLYKNIPRILFRKTDYPKSSFLNFPALNHKMKYSFISKDASITFVSPSIWLQTLIKKYMPQFRAIKINNAIDLDIFKPIETDRYFNGFSFEEKIVVLSISNIWSEDKGIKHIIEISKVLPENYIVVIVGKYSNPLPKNIVHFDFIQNKLELVKLYNIADVFFNPTLKDNYPTVNMEAIACGTPIIAFDIGGNKEVVNEKTGIIILSSNEFSKALNEILHSDKENNVSCRKYALKNFNQEKMLNSYTKVYYNN